LPYLYTLAHEATRSGAPIARPVFFHDPTDPELRAVDDAFLLGSDLLVIARTSPESEFVVPVAFGAWPVIDLGVDDAEDPQLPQLRLRPGSALPLAPLALFTTDADWDSLEWVVAPDAQGRARAVTYEDAGEGFAHLEGDFRELDWRWQVEPDDRAARFVSGIDGSSRWPLPARDITQRVVR
jgi:alpha-glucosidase